MLPRRYIAEWKKFAPWPEDAQIEQLKLFLKEMFQFNAIDLDFGIYRIYHLKRKEIEHFNDGKEANCLTPGIDLTLKVVANFEKKAELASLETYLKTLNKLDLICR